MGIGIVNVECAVRPRLEQLQQLQMLQLQPLYSLEGTGSHEWLALRMFFLYHQERPERKTRDSAFCGAP